MTELSPTVTDRETLDSRSDESQAVVEGAANDPLEVSTDSLDALTGETKSERSQLLTASSSPPLPPPTSLPSLASNPSPHAQPPPSLTIPVTVIPPPIMPTSSATVAVGPRTRTPDAHLASIPSTLSSYAHALSQSPNTPVPPVPLCGRCRLRTPDWFCGMCNTAFCNDCEQELHEETLEEPSGEGANHANKHQASAGSSPYSGFSLHRREKYRPQLPIWAFPLPSSDILPLLPPLPDRVVRSSFSRSVPPPVWRKASASSTLSYTAEPMHVAAAMRTASVDSRRSSASLLLHQPLFCSVHPQHLQQYYCATCDEAVCNKCIKEKIHPPRAQPERGVLTMMNVEKIAKLLLDGDAPPSSSASMSTSTSMSSSSPPQPQFSSPSCASAASLHSVFELPGATQMAFLSLWGLLEAGLRPRFCAVVAELHRVQARLNYLNLHTAASPRTPLMSSPSATGGDVQLSARISSPGKDGPSQAQVDLEVAQLGPYVGKLQTEVAQLNEFASSLSSMFPTLFLIPQLWLQSGHRIESSPHSHSFADTFPASSSQHSHQHLVFPWAHSLPPPISPSPLVSLRFLQRYKTIWSRLLTLLTTSFPRPVSETSFPLSQSAPPLVPSASPLPPPPSTTSSQPASKRPALEQFPSAAVAAPCAPSAPPAKTSTTSATTASSATGPEPSHPQAIPSASAPHLSASSSSSSSAVSSPPAPLPPLRATAALSSTPGDDADASYCQCHPSRAQAHRVHLEVSPRCGRGRSAQCTLCSCATCTHSTVSRSLQCHRQHHPPFISRACRCCGPAPTFSTRNHTRHSPSHHHEVHHHALNHPDDHLQSHHLRQQSHATQTKETSLLAPPAFFMSPVYPQEHQQSDLNQYHQQQHQSQHRRYVHPPPPPPPPPPPVSASSPGSRQPEDYSAVERTLLELSSLAQREVAQWESLAERLSRDLAGARLGM